jgi:hypothetical protein
MSFSFGYSPWLLLVSLLAAGGLTYWTYRDPTPSLPTGARWLLGSLRFLALAILILLLLEPVVQRVQETVRPPILAVVIDDSESLTVTTTSGSGASPNEAGGDDGRAARQQAAERAVRQAVDRLRERGIEGEQRFFAFDRSARSLGSSSPLDSLRLRGARTDIAAALQSVREGLQGENLGAVALLSDGQYNTGRNPLYVADRFPVPIHTVTIGDTTRRRDVQVRRVTTNDLAYVDTEVPVAVGLRSEDAGGERVTVTLEQDGTALDTASVTLPEGTAEVPIDLSFVPGEAGLQRLTVRATQIDGEATSRNNRQTVTLRVLESRRQVLLLGGAPSPDYAAARRLLSRDTDTELTVRTPQRGGGFYEGPLPDTLSAFDVMVLAGFPGPAASPSTVETVAAAAEEVPTLFLLDRSTDLAALRDGLGDVVPVQPERIRSGFDEAAFTPASEEAQHPVFRLESVGLEAFDRLPPLRVSQTQWQATPDARVLATPTVRGVTLDEPLLALRSRAGTRSAAFLGVGTWRWANLPADLQDAEAAWPGLLANLVRWAATRQDDRPVRVRPVRSTFAGGERVELTGQVYDESMAPVSDASVEVTVRAPDSTQYPYTMEPEGNGRYALDIGALPQGTYQYEATARFQGRKLGEDRGRFSVGSLTLEYRETRANLPLMRQIAQRSGGTSFSPDSAGALGERLAASGAFESVVSTETAEVELWHLWGFLALVLALLAAEWALRKRYGLV